MSCQDKTLHARGECQCCFTSAHFLEPLEYERQGFEILMLAGLAPGANPTYQARMMLTERTYWLRS
jgi:hypothetical protein